MLVLVNCSIGEPETDIDKDNINLVDNSDENNQGNVENEPRNEEDTNNKEDTDNKENDSDDRENEMDSDEEDEFEQGKCLNMS